jgi:hypothetical protein
MDAMERERLTKAHHAAQLLLADAREVHAKTDSVALEELMIGVITQDQHQPTAQKAFGAEGLILD